MSEETKDRVCGQPRKGKTCVKCGQINAVARKTCSKCDHVFKQRIKSGFKEMPVILTSDRLRPTRHIRMKRSLYSDTDYIYNVSMALYSKRGRGSSQSYQSGRRGKFSSRMCDQDELYDKALNDAALESIANSIIANSKSTGKNKIEKLYPKRERHKASRYQCYSGATNIKILPFLNEIKEEPDDEETIDQNASDLDDEEVDCKSCSSDDANNGNTDNTNSISNSTRMKSKLQNGKISNENGLKKLIRGEISKTLKNKLLHRHVTSPLPVPRIKEDVLCDDIESDKVAQENGMNLDIANIKEEILLMVENDNAKTTSDHPNDIQQDGSHDETLSEDDKPLKEIIKSTKNMSGSSKDENIVEIPVRKKMGRPRIHPIRPKKPVGRPRIHPLNSKSKRKYIKKGKPTYDVDTDISVTELTNEDTDISDINNSPLKTFSDKKEIKRGRPKGCKDSKPRKIRNDYIQRLIDQKVDVDGLINMKTMQKSKKSGKNLLSPPSLMSSASNEEHRNNDVLDAEEIERIERRLNKTNPFIIPDCKKELYSTILDEINRRISSQSFQSSILINEV